MNHGDLWGRVVACTVNGMGRIWLRMAWIALALVASACGGGAVETGVDSSSSPSTTAGVIPAVDDLVRVDIQARAFKRECRVNCLAVDSTPLPLREALAEHAVDVEFISASEVEETESGEGRFAEGAALITVQPLRRTERSDVKRVDVHASRGFGDASGRTYLFLWSGTAWVNTTADAVSATVTSFTTWVRITIRHSLRSAGCPDLGNQMASCTVEEAWDKFGYARFGWWLSGL